MKKNNQGVSLLELIIVIIVVVVLGAFSGAALINFMKLAGQQTISGDIQGQSRVAFDQMVKSIQTAVNVAGCASAYDNNIDLNDVNGNHIIYSASGNSLWRQGGAGDGELANNITLIDFKCLDSNGVMTVVDSNARYIRIEMTAKKDTSEVNYRTTVLLRNK
jgi:prepilin-type N-terminal cleavage/methylation domain-containing protein